MTGNENGVSEEGAEQEFGANPSTWTVTFATNGAWHAKG